MLTRTFQHQCEALCVRLFRVVLQTSVPHCTDKAVVVAHTEPISSSCDWPRHWESLPSKALHTEWNPKMSRSLNPGFRCDCINRPQNFRIARDFLFQKLQSITIWQGSITTHFTLGYTSGRWISHESRDIHCNWSSRSEPLALQVLYYKVTLRDATIGEWFFLFSPLKVVSPVRYKRCLFLVL